MGGNLRVEIEKMNYKITIPSRRLSVPWLNPWMYTLLSGHAVAIEVQSVSLDPNLLTHY